MDSSSQSTTNSTDTNPPNGQNNESIENGQNSQIGDLPPAEELFPAQTMPASTEQLNMRCTGVKRLLKEAIELRQPNELFCARPMEDNLFEWHFTVRGPPDTPFADGVYHGRIVLPAEYPMKPPNLILLTPNGRFETNKKICLSISGYHPETWLPSWSIRTALLALIGFMPTHSAGALGGLDCSQEERRRLALKSQDWCCPQCGVKMRDALPAPGTTGKGGQLMAEVKSASASATSNQKQIETGSKSTATNQQLDNENNSLSSQTIPAPTLTTPNVQPQQILAPQQNSTAQNANSNSITSSSTTNSPLLENPLIWIFFLSVLFIALLFRRLLLNYAANAGQMAPENNGNDGTGNLH